MSAQSWATIHGTMVSATDDREKPRLKVLASHRAVGNILCWPGQVLPIFQQALCSLPVLAMATVLDVGELWLYDQRLKRIVPIAERQRCMAVVVGSKQLTRIQVDDVLPCVTEVLLSLQDGNDNVAADARQTLDTLDLGPVVEAPPGGQRLMVASARSPGQARVDVIGEIVHDYWKRLLAGGKPSLPAVRWPRLLEYLSGGLLKYFSRGREGQPVLVLASTREQAKQSLLRSATARALSGALLRYNVTYNDV